MTEKATVLEGGFMKNIGYQDNIEPGNRRTGFDFKGIPVPVMKFSQTNDLKIN